MKFILSIVGICTLFACAAPKAPITKSVETKKKEAYKEDKITNKPVQRAITPKVEETTIPVSPSSPESKPIDTREY